MSAHNADKKGENFSPRGETASTIRGREKLRKMRRV